MSWRELPLIFITTGAFGRREHGPYTSHRQNEEWRERWRDAITLHSARMQRANPKMCSLSAPSASHVSQWVRCAIGKTTSSRCISLFVPGSVPVAASKFFICRGRFLLTVFVVNSLEGGAQMLRFNMVFYENETTNF